jgi:hypothetical protein
MSLRQQVKSKAIELSSSLFYAIQADQSFYEELLNDYYINIGALKYVDDPYPMELAIDLEEKMEPIKKILPRVSDDMFDQYTVMLGMLGACYMDVRHE